jgi:UDP-N-acetylmuramyl pentapeptide phosphotransferase/UDP-N-acetylglucosamine-1-phosphate transferase
MIAIGCTVLWFLLFINAINWIDGINGISTGVTSIGFLTIYLLITRIVIPLYGVVEPEVIMAQELSGILFGISVVYASIERKPLALVRDIGVMFLGFMLAYLSLLGGGKIGIIMVSLALVIFDAAWVIINRMIIMHKNPLKGDYTHLHHRLLRLGRSRSEVRVFVRGRSLFLMIIMLLQ